VCEEGIKHVTARSSRAGIRRGCEVAEVREFISERERAGGDALLNAGELVAGATQVHVGRGTQYGGAVTLPLEEEIESDSSRAYGSNAARLRSLAHRSIPRTLVTQRRCNAGIDALVDTQDGWEEIRCLARVKRGCRHDRLTRRPIVMRQLWRCSGLAAEVQGPNFLEGAVTP